VAEDDIQANTRSKTIREVERYGAGDGNRTRMTSLEGSGHGSADQPERRSDGVPACP
jgi:hypothetical protein